MPFPTNEWRKIRGFTMLEVVVMVAILTLLVGLLAPAARNMILDAKAAKILDLADTLREACMRFHLDTGQLAREFSGSTASPNWTPDKHLLSMPQDPVLFKGWKGPYLSDPISFDDHPEGNEISVMETLALALFPGFDLQDNGALLSGAGNMLVFEEISPELAQRVDQIRDGHLNTPTRWKQSGEVNYTESSGNRGTLYIFLFAE